jgi:predicted HTH domain antitoxin
VSLWKEGRAASSDSHRAQPEVIDFGRIRLLRGRPSVTRLHVDLNIPDTVSDALREELQLEAREQVVLALFRRGVCSAGLAAELLSRTYAEFLAFLKERGVDYTVGDASDTAAYEATLRWMDPQPNARRSP